MSLTMLTKLALKNYIIKKIKKIRKKYKHKILAKNNEDNIV